jgi:hypothetical protein
MLVAATALLTACSRDPTLAENAAPEFWAIQTIAPDTSTGPPPLLFLDAATIAANGAALRATAVVFIALPPDLSRHGVRLDVVNDYDCTQRKMRPVTTTVTARDGPPLTNQENLAWVVVDEVPNLDTSFEFVCATDEARLADARFTRTTDPRPLGDIADSFFSDHQRPAAQ